MTEHRMVTSTGDGAGGFVGVAGAHLRITPEWAKAAQLEIELVPTDFFVTLRQVRQHEERKARMIDATEEMERRAAFRGTLCQCWRALTLGHGTIQSIYEAPLTVWLLTGEFP